LGCLVGPVVANYYTDPKRPSTLQAACVGSMAIMGAGWVGIMAFPNFWTVCAFSSLRTFGAAILITNSTLLLQRLSAKEMLGRVLSFEFAFSMGFDSLSNYTAGVLQDEGWNKEEIAAVAATLASGLFLFLGHLPLFRGRCSRKFFLNTGFSRRKRYRRRGTKHTIGYKLHTEKMKLVDVQL